MKKESARKSKGAGIFRIAAIAGILVVVLAIVGVIISQILQGNAKVLSIWSICQSIAYSILGIVFVYGFYALGKKYNNNFLKIMAALMIIFSIVSFFVSLFVVSPMIANGYSIADAKAQAYSVNSEMSDEQAQTFWQDLFQDSEFRQAMISVFGLFAVGVIFTAILSILFGVSLTKLKEKVEYSKVAGILEIVGGATLIIIIGLPILFVAFIFELIILFKEAQK